MKFKIVIASLEHLEEVSTLFNAYRIFYDQASDLKGATRYIKSHLEKRTSTIFLAIDEDETPLGFTQLYPMFSSIAMGPTYILNDLFIAQHARKSGVGSALLEAARRWAKEKGAIRLELETESSNLPAQALYKKLGWVRNDEIFEYSLAL